MNRTKVHKDNAAELKKKLFCAVSSVIRSRNKVASLPSNESILLNQSALEEILGRLLDFILKSCLHLNIA